jgi:hypothetical protein
MIQRIRGNGIPSWPEALRRAALPLQGVPGMPPEVPSRPSPARTWRASRLAGYRGTPGSANSSRTGRLAKDTRVEITIAPAMSSGCRS